MNFDKLNDCLISNGFNPSHIEGNMSNVPEQCATMIRLCQLPYIKNVLEIGFNSGHSSELMLRTNPLLSITSFDLGKHAYTAVAKEYIDKRYPLRHVLLLGNSMKSVPAFHHMHPDVKFDLIFIDGGHDYITAKADLVNCRHLAHTNTLVVMDDVVYSASMAHTAGPTTSWKQMIEHGSMVEYSHTEFSPGRGQCIGKYILDQVDVISESNFLGICDFVFTPALRLDALFDGCIIYMELTYYDYFIQHINEIKHRFKIISGYSDMAVTDHSELLDNPLLISWHAVNKCRNHPKLFPIPKGVQENIPQLNPDGYMEWCMNKIIHKEYLHAIYRHSLCFIKEHIALKDKHGPLLFISYTSHCAFRNHLDAYIAQSEFCKSPLCEWELYKEQLQRHKFALCPFGVGQDRYKVWECLALGTIPVVFKSVYSEELYTDLPIVVLSLFEELTSDYLNQAYDRIVDRINTWNYSKLTIEYWKSNVASH